MIAISSVRSLPIQLLAAAGFATFSYLSIQLVYDWEMAQAGMRVGGFDAGVITADTLAVHGVSFSAWVALTMLGAALNHRFQRSRVLARALAAERRRGEEVSLILEVSEALSGSLDVADIAARFLRLDRRVLSARATAAIALYDERPDSFRVIATNGPRAAEFTGRNYPLAVLPGPLRARLVEQRQPLALPDTNQAGPAWSALTTRIPHLATARAFYVLPLFTRDRLIGGLIVRDDVPHAVEESRLRLLGALAQHLAGALLNALTMAESESRARREALVNQVAQRARASLDAHDILQSTLEDLGRTLGASRALLRLTATDGTIRVAHEWTAEGVPAINQVHHPLLPICALAVSAGRPVAIEDIFADPRLDEGSLGDPRALALQDVRAVLACPVGLGGHASGVFVLHQVESPRVWTGNDVRLVEDIAHELTVALETVRLFEERRHAEQTALQAADALTTANTELERLNRAKSEFVSIVGHEFRTPLTGIQGFSEMMRDEDLTLAELKEYAADINKDARRLNRLITEMLDLDRMESGQMTLSLEPVDANAIVEAVAALVRPNAPRHPIRLHLDRAAPPVSADPDKLTQVVTNLVNNAVKYSPAGGEVAVATTLVGECLHITVRDHGMGIPSESLETVFERYTRVESGAMRTIQGTGLGLPIVRQIVELHGGRVWAESEAGQGSTFHVTLPLAPAPSAPPAPIPAPVAAPAGA